MAVAQAQIQVEGRSIPLTHPDKVFWPELGLTKSDLIDYYLEVSPYLLPHLRGRPFIMRPFPDGVGGRSYYRWALPRHAPPWLHRWRYHAKAGDRTIEMLVVEGLPELAWAANQACIEMHPWLSRRDDPAHPDAILFDLDPGPGVDFAACLEVASWLHAALDRLALRHYAKTSGGAGLHVLVPVERRYTFSEVRRWVRAVARPLAEAHPGRLTLDKSLAARPGRVLIDYSQNGLGKSAVAPYSARANPQAMVSAPLSWGEVARGRVRPADLNLRTVPPRLRRSGDPLAPLLEGQPLPPLESLGA